MVFTAGAIAACLRATAGCNNSHAAEAAPQCSTEILSPEKIMTARILTATASLAIAAAASAQMLGPDFSGSYSFSDLGSVPGLPSNYGGLAFLNNNTLLIGGAANTQGGSLYTVQLVRDMNNRITGFTGMAERFGGPLATIGDYNDGGVSIGPDSVVFTSRWPVNGLGQTKPGSLDEDKIIDLAQMGVASSHAAHGIVPGGFAGAGTIKLVSYSGGQWYSSVLTPDGMGTFDITSLVQVDLDPVAMGIQNVPGGPEGFVYISGANDGFMADSVLISEYAAGMVGAYEIDAEGNPLVATRRTFLSDLTGAEGAVFDPVTGDFLFSTFGGGSRVVLVTGFIAPVPEPGTWALLAVGAAALVAGRQRRAPSR